MSPFQIRKEEPFPAPPYRSKGLAVPAVAPSTRSTVLDSTSGAACKDRPSVPLPVQIDVPCGDEGRPKDPVAEGRQGADS